MRMTLKIALAVFALTAVEIAPAASATLIGQTFNGSIVITGQDDNGFYTIPVFSGPITVGGSGFSTDIPVFKQLTEGGFSTPTNQITGDVALAITGNTISVTMNGQVQPFELESTFTGHWGIDIYDYQQRRFCDRPDGRRELGFVFQLHT